MVLFEDKRTDILSKLFMAAYPDDISSTFEYCDGSPAMVSRASKLLESTNEIIYVFMDSVPGNRDIVTNYTKLVKAAKKYKGRLYIFNIVCAEYYFLKAFGKDSAICKSDKGLDIALNKGMYLDSPLLETEEDKKFSKNHEKYCKLVLMKNYRDCARHSRGSVENNDVNLMYGYFYEKECLCKVYDRFCRSRQLVDKATQFVRQYPCIPMGISRSGVIRKFSTAELIIKHRSLVDEFNAWVDLYNSDKRIIEAGKKVPHIKYAI